MWYVHIYSITGHRRTPLIRVGRLIWRATNCMHVRYIPGTIDLYRVLQATYSHHPRLPANVGTPHTHNSPIYHPPTHPPLPRSKIQTRFTLLTKTELVDRFVYSQPHEELTTSKSRKAQPTYQHPTPQEIHASNVSSDADKPMPGLAEEACQLISRRSEERSSGRVG